MPTSLSGLTLWLRADMGITIGTGVSAWADQSGQGHSVTQGTAAAQPAFVASAVNGKPGVLFDGVDDILVAASNITDAASTYFAVASQVTTSATYKCIFGTQKHTLYARRDVADIWEAYYNGDCPSTVQLTATPAVLEVCARAFNDVDLVNNGSSVTSNAGTAFNGNATSVGGVAATFFGNVQIEEIVFYNRILTATERSRVRKYLGNRYGIAVLT